MKLYHASKDPHIAETVIYPRLPKYRLKTEELKIPRICTSPSILGCLCALPRLLEGEKIFIYSCEAKKYFQPTEEQVADVVYTGEIWLLEATKLEYYAEISIVKAYSSVVDNCEINFYDFKIVDK